MSVNLNLAEKTLCSARKKDYAGYSKFDALNSPFLSSISLDNKWLRLLLVQLVNRSPWHLRPLLGVKKSRNPKGIALFIRAYLHLFVLTGNPFFLEEAQTLLAWLLDNKSPGRRNFCWGYNFLWQSTLFVQERGEPNAVVTTFVGEALLHAYRVTGKNEYLDAARSVADFILTDLPVLHEEENERAIAYVPGNVRSVVLNNQVLTGAFLVKVWKHTGEKELLHTATRQINYTVKRKTDYHAWYYTYPAEKSAIIHDNYHTGGILDGLLEYQEETRDNRYSDSYWKGLDYYQNNLFEIDGAPRWMNNRRYPYDAHGAAQGIISFAKAGKHEKRYLEMAEKIAHWSHKNLYREETGDFIYRIGKNKRWNYSLMRWCNAWMARALGELVLRQE